MALPPSKAHVRIVKPSCWTLLKALCLCMLLAVCTTVIYPVLNAFLGQDVLVATPSAVIATAHGDDYIWDSGASMDLLGSQDIPDLAEKDKIYLDPPLPIDTAAGRQYVEYKVKTWCKPFMQWIYPLVMPEGDSQGCFRRSSLYR